jgi:peptide-methionine (S)-S-oxide reductase
MSKRLSDRGREALRAALVLTIVAAGAAAAAEPARKVIGMKSTSASGSPESAQVASTRQQAVLGAGCFWCIEAVFQRIPGVVSVEPGYAGGHVANPTYKQVCGGKTGHAEVARIEFDPGQVSFAQLLEIFWKSHDPTTLNRQGADVGDQYRSVIFYADEDQRWIAEESRREAQASGAFKSRIVTLIEPLRDFYPAENYHQDYYERNRNAPYCQFVIRPKLEKLGLE